VPTREVVNTLLRHDLDIVREPIAPYFRDIYDHVIRAAEWNESLGDLVTSITQTEQANRTKVVMKR
jgi:magnesium transporter